MTTLPIAPLLPQIASSLAQHHRLILHAPPGSGKTTGVPPALLDCPWLQGRKILLLEPRRLAARAAAQRMAQTCGEEVGQSVGYRMRMERRISARTRIEVITEGLFTRLLQHDPELGGVGAVLFDEFHERSLDADLGLALALDVQSSLRPDLRLVIMSATLDDERLRGLLDAPVLSAESRSFPVTLEYPALDPRHDLQQTVARAVDSALDRYAGHVLVFLPGMREIRRCQALLNNRQHARVEVLALHGSLPAAEQLQALQPAASGIRKVILASAVAETSLTIDGIGVVVDAGLERRSRYDLRSGMARLETVPASRASAEQRSGRAGRTAAGHCIRLWSESSHGRRAAHADAEILLADLMPLVLELAAWGVTDPTDLAWLDLPPTSAWARARAALQALGALDEQGRPTPHGRAMIESGLHPRLAHMVLRSRDQVWAYTACWMAALLEDNEALNSAGNTRRALDLEAVIDQADVYFTPGLRQRLNRAAERIGQRLGIARRPLEAQVTGTLIALAYPERIAQQRDGARQRYRLRNGRGASLAAGDGLAGSAWLAIAELGAAGPAASQAGPGKAADVEIRAAAGLSLSDLQELYADEFEVRRRVFWDPDNASVQAREQVCLGALVLSDRRLNKPAPAEIESAMLAGIRQSGIQCLPWTERLRQWQARVALLRAHELCEPLPPDCTDGTLMDDLEQWLAPWIKGMSRIEQLRGLDLSAALHARLDWSQQQLLREQLPEALTVPSGSVLNLDYCQGEQPVLAVRLQEMFGAAATPRIAGGRIRVQVHLLSPARRPVQVTSDLDSFWDQTYQAVRKELRGRYPKHAWPENPRTAQALRGVPKRKI